MPRQARKQSGTGIYHVMRAALDLGAGLRQLSRLTGVTYGVIHRLSCTRKTD